MLHTLQNKHWQAGILPQAGASVAFGRVRYSGTWLDLLRPTDEANYDNSSKASSFIMLPWANRIRDGRFMFEGETYQLQTTKDDGTARHGDVRKRPWEVMHSSETDIRLRFRSTNFADINWPFAFSAVMHYRLEEAEFVWQLTLTNEDERAFPAGFGFHPYFVREGDVLPHLQVPCDKQFVLHNSMADSAPVPITPALDFRELRPVPGDLVLDDLLTQRDPEAPVRLVYPPWNVELHMHADEIFQHILLFTAPDGTLAVEPQTNANDGVNLLAQGIPGSGVFVLGAGESRTGTVRLRVQ